MSEHRHEKLQRMTDALRQQHNERFRRVANHYPRRVADAYDWDLARAAKDSDEQVAATVAAWERARGLPVTDWPAIGRAKSRDDRA